MKISLHWLNQLLDRPTDTDEAARVLTAMGFPVEETEQVTTSDGSTDVMLDVEVTSNRSDCLSHVGVAREFAAGAGCELNPPEIDPPASDGTDVNTLATVTNHEPDLCQLYTARIIRNVKVGPSPDWLRRALESIGQDSINNVADITNYVLMQMGQPLHAFDYDKLAGHAIVVRKAKQGESIAALNAETYKLTPDHLVIADANDPVAIAGVMGGELSKVTESTTNVLLEAAMFDIVSVRHTVRNLKVKVKNKLGTESSFRFERGIDPLGVDRASRYAAKLICELAGGTLAEGVIRVGAEPPTPRAVTMRIARCDALLGIQLGADRIVDLLQRLGLFPTLNDAGDAVTCVVPTFRLDIEREVDLIEEVARANGLADIPVREKIDIVAQQSQPHVDGRRRIGRTLVAHGFHETITFSFLTVEQGDMFLAEGESPALVEHNLRKQEPVLRPSLIPSLLRCRKMNYDVGNTNVKLFETGSTWRRGADQKISEQVTLALLADVGEGQAAAAAQTMAALRSAIAELIQQLGDHGASVDIKPADPPNFDTAATVAVNGQAVGSFGLLSAQAGKAFDLKVNVAVAELELAPLLALYPPKHQVGPLPKFPAIERDLSVILSEATPWAEVEQHVLATEPAMLEQLAFVETYRGKPIPKGQKSISFRMRFRDPETTLRHEQVDPQVNQVIERLKAKVNAELRD